MNKWTNIFFITIPWSSPWTKSTLISQPKVRLASKFERQVDRRTFVDKKGLYDGVSADVKYIPVPSTSRNSSNLSRVHFKSRIIPKDRYLVEFNALKILCWPLKKNKLTDASYLKYQTRTHANWKRDATSTQVWSADCWFHRNDERSHHKQLQHWWL